MPESKFDVIVHHLSNVPVNISFVKSFQPDGLVEAKYGATSQPPWVIAPTEIRRLIDDLESRRPMLIRLKTTVIRKTYSEEMHSAVSVMTKIGLHHNDPERSQLIEMLRNVINTDVDVATRVANSIRLSVRLKHLLPKLLHVQEQVVRPMQLYDGSLAFQPVRNVRLNLVLHDDGETMSWRLSELCPPDPDEDVFECKPDGEVHLFVFSDPIEQLRALGRMGIISLYTTVCLVCARKLRGLVFGGLHRIIYTEMPQVDTMLQLCYDFYLVRASGEFALEEDLFAKLLFLHRSPATLAEYTRLVEPPPVLESWVIKEVEATDDRKIQRMRGQLAEL